MSLYNNTNTSVNLGIVLQGNQDNIFMDWNGANGMGEIDYNIPQLPNIPIAIGTSGGSVLTPIDAAITELSVITLAKVFKCVLSIAVIEISVATITKMITSIKTITEISMMTIAKTINSVKDVTEMAVISAVKQLIKVLNADVLESASITLLCGFLKRWRMKDMKVWFKGVAYKLEQSLVDGSGNFVTGQTINYTIKKSSNDSLFLSGAMGQEGYLYVAPVTFTDVGQYRVIYDMPAGYANGNEMINVINDIDAGITDLKDVQLGRWSLDMDANTLTLYRQDGITVLRVFTLTQLTGTAKTYRERT